MQNITKVTENLVMNQLFPIPFLIRYDAMFQKLGGDEEANSRNKAGQILRKKKELMA